MNKDHKARHKTRQEIQAHRRRVRESGFEFPLTETSLGLPADELQYAHVRRITLTDQAAISQLPVNLQTIVNEGLDYVQQEQRRMVKEDTVAKSLEDRVRNLTALLPAADAFCIATFIEPKLVRTESELDQYPDAWLVDDIDPADRIDWFYACTDADSQAAKKLIPFRERSNADVATGAVVSIHQPTATPAVEPAPRD